MPGVRGLTVLILTGAIGLCFAIIGWMQRDNGLVTPAVPSSNSASHARSHSGAHGAARADGTAPGAHAAALGASIAAAVRPGGARVYVVSAHGQALR
jgi:hypothetical protein